MFAPEPKMLYKIRLGANPTLFLLQSIVWCSQPRVLKPTPFNLRPLTALFWTHSKNGRERLSSHYKFRQTHLQTRIHVIIYTRQRTLVHSQKSTLCLLTKTVNFWELIKFKQISGSWILIIHVFETELLH